MAITWQNVAGPNLTGATQLLNNAASNFGRGLQNLSNQARDYADKQQADRIGNVTQGLLQDSMNPDLDERAFQENALKQYMDTGATFEQAQGAVNNLLASRDAQFNRDIAKEDRDIAANQRAFDNSLKSANLDIAERRLGEDVARNSLLNLQTAQNIEFDKQNQAAKEISNNLLNEGRSLDNANKLITVAGSQAQSDLNQDKEYLSNKASEASLTKSYQTNLEKEDAKLRKKYDIDNQEALRESLTSTSFNDGYASLQGQIEEGFGSGSDKVALDNALNEVFDELNIPVEERGYYMMSAGNIMDNDYITKADVDSDKLKEKIRRTFSSVEKQKRKALNDYDSYQTDLARYSQERGKKLLDIRESNASKEADAYKNSVERLKKQFPRN